MIQMTVQPSLHLSLAAQRIRVPWNEAVLTDTETEMEGETQRNGFASNPALTIAHM